MQPTPVKVEYPQAGLVAPSGGATLIRAAWGVLALAAAAMLWVMVGVWASQPEMNDRWLIPLASAFVVYRFWPRWRARTAKPSLWGLTILALGAAAFPAAWFLTVHVGPRVILLWWLLAALGLAAFGLAVVQSGWGRARLLIFPIAFTFFTLPVPDLVMAPLQRVLQEGTTATAAEALSWCGMPVQRSGFVLRLPTGELGVVEACSGVRSVSALTAIAVFVAYIRGLGLLRGAILLVLSLGIIVISNAFRVIASGLLMENVGRWAIDGWYHEALGISVVLIGLFLIVLVSGLLVRRDPGRESGDSNDAVPRAQPRPGGLFARLGPAVALGLLAAAAAGCVWSEQFRQAHREEVQLERLAHEIAGWQGQDAKIDAIVAEMLKCDQIIHRTYSNVLGQEVQVYIMFWATPASTAHIHHPDVCFPNKGFAVTSGTVQPIPLGTSRPPLRVSSRLYTLHPHCQLIYYWTQRGNEVLPDGKEPSVSIWSEYAWVAALLRGRAAPDRQARLSVLVGSEVTGSPEAAEARLTAFTTGLAREVYRVCPWALPMENGSQKKDEPAGRAGL
jgi:EpsI family protein